MQCLKLHVPQSGGIQAEDPPCSLRLCVPISLRTPEPRTQDQYPEPRTKNRKPGQDQEPETQDQNHRDQPTGNRRTGMPCASGWSEFRKRTATGETIVTGQSQICRSSSMKLAITCSKLL